jgi:hypothetical protein
MGRRGVLIAIEHNCDPASLAECSKQCETLRNRVVKEGGVANVYRFPHTDAAGMELAACLSGKDVRDPATLYELFVKSRTELQREICRDISRGVTVICDTYVFGDIAWNVASGWLDEAWILDKMTGLMVPDYLIVIRSSAMPSSSSFSPHAMAWLVRHAPLGPKVSRRVIDMARSASEQTADAIHAAWCFADQRTTSDAIPTFRRDQTAPPFRHKTHVGRFAKALIRRAGWLLAFYLSVFLLKTLGCLMDGVPGLFHSGALARLMVTVAHVLPPFNLDTLNVFRVLICDVVDIDLNILVIHDHLGLGAILLHNMLVIPLTRTFLFSL